MTFNTERILPREVLPETASLFDITQKFPTEKQIRLFDFIRGVRYGMDLEKDPLQASPDERREGA